MPGLSGRPWRRLQKQVLAQSTICIVCGHAGSDSVDHIISRANGGDPYHPANLAPAHHLPCPTCRMRCNSVKGTKSLADVRPSRSSRVW